LLPSVTLKKLAQTPALDKVLAFSQLQEWLIVNVIKDILERVVKIENDFISNNLYNLYF